MSQPGINDSTSTQRLLSLCGMETTVKKTPGSEKKTMGNSEQYSYCWKNQQL